MRSWVVVVMSVIACDHDAAPQRPNPPPATASTPAPATAAAPTPAPAPVAEAPLAEPNRPLTAGERTLLVPIFRDSIDYEKVRVIHAAFPFQPSGVYMTPRGHIYAPGDLFSDDFSRTDPAVFVHEMTHVWQFENGMDLIAQGVATFAKYNGAYEKAYAYTLDASGRDLIDYGMEQQASIVEDYFLVSVRHRSPQQLQNRVSSAERDQLYAAVLGKFLGNARYARTVPASEVVERHASAQPPPAPTAPHARYLCPWRFSDGKTR